MPSYPIDSILPGLKQAIVKNSSLVLHAPPGAGKTTRVPLALLDIMPGRIVMLEPRRIAAVSAARWMAQSLGEQPGSTVGYTIRFDSKVTSKTRVEVVTEGVLTRRIQSDPGLEGVSLVIFDEFHERSIHADLALALCLDVRKGLRPDLKILVMSATLDTGPVSSLLGDAMVMSSSGKAFPVQERYPDLKPGYVSTRVKSAVRAALRETEGDILAFLPGSGEIRACAKELQEAGTVPEDRIALHPLYGDLPFEEQERAILPSKERRKVVLATNIAETSLTIEGVRVVIDSGLSRRLRYDPATGMNRLVTVPVSKSSAEQRKGRAGRLGTGVCYRLYGKHELHGMPDFAPPEIIESDLSRLALELAAWGIKEPSLLSWLDAPPAPSWNSAVRLLRELGAVDSAGSITPAGREIARFPLHPRLGRLILRAHELGCPGLGADLASILSERDIIRRSAAKPGGQNPDITDRIGTLYSWRTGKGTGDGDPAALRAVDRTARHLRRLTAADTGEAGPGDHELTARLLLSAFPDRICKRREESRDRFVLTQGRGIRIPAGSHLVNSEYIVAPVLDAGEKAEGFVRLAAPVTEDLIRIECDAAIETVRKVEWSRAEGRIVSAVEERIGSVLLSKKDSAASDDQAVPIVCEVIRTTPNILTFGSALKQFQARVALVARNFLEETWPDLSNERLFSKPEEWLLPWLGGVRTDQALRSLDILPALRALLTHEQQRRLDERAPLHITVPSGSKIKVDYAAGDEPVLAVKLQEMFGLADTPLIAGGRVKVLLHLLSPAQRPVQVTRDLKNFWNSGYPLVKKDLKGRYPKHPWPDDPWNALPTRRTKRRGE